MRKAVFIALVILSLTISACNVQADGTFGNITGPQGPQGTPGTNGTTNIDQAVANSNLTTSLGYRLTWNGTNTVFLPPSFGGSLTYYLNSNITSDVATYFTLTDTVHTSSHNTSTVVNVGNTTVANFITQANNPAVTFIPSGSYDVHIHTSSTGSKPVYLFAEIWETAANGTDIAKIGTTENTPLLSGTKTEHDIVYVAPNVYALNSTASRIDLRIIATATAGSASSVYLYCGGTDDSHISLPGTQVTINNFVPYTGANKPLDMGAHNMTTTSNISAGNFFTTAIGWFNQYLLNLSGNLSSNFTAWTQNDTNLSGNISLKLNTSNVTRTATAGKVPEADANGVIDTWVTQKVCLRPIDTTTNLTVSNTTAFITIPSELDGWSLVNAQAAVYTVSSSGTPTFNIYSTTNSTYVLSTAITIDANELTSYTAATPSVINATYKVMHTGYQLRVDVTAAGTGTQGADIYLTFRKP